MTAGAIIALLTALATLLVKVWPAPKTQAERSKDEQARQRGEEREYDESGDNSDLGRLP